jgi:hypothetical protein
MPVKKMFWNKFYFRKIAIVWLSDGIASKFITEYREGVVLMQAQIYCIKFGGQMGKSVL